MWTFHYKNVVVYLIHRRKSGVYFYNSKQEVESHSTLVGIHNVFQIRNFYKLIYFTITKLTRSKLFLKIIYTIEAAVGF